MGRPPSSRVLPLLPVFLARTDARPGHSASARRRRRVAVVPTTAFLGPAAGNDDEADHPLRPFSPFRPEFFPTSASSLSLFPHSLIPLISVTAGRCRARKRPRIAVRRRMRLLRTVVGWGGFKSSLRTARSNILSFPFVPFFSSLFLSFCFGLPAHCEFLWRVRS